MITLFPSQGDFCATAQPGFRHRHIGGALLEKLFAVAEHHRIQRFLVSSVSKEMDKILIFYRSHGFKPWYVQMFKKMEQQVSHRG